MGNLPIKGNLPIEAYGIPNIGWSNSQYRLQDLPVVGIATVFTLASIVCTYNHITVYISAGKNIFASNIFRKNINSEKKNACITISIGMSPILTFHGVKPKLFVQITNTTSVSRVFFLRKDSLLDSSYSIEGLEDHRQFGKG